MVIVFYWSGIERSLVVKKSEPQIQRVTQRCILSKVSTVFYSVRSSYGVFSFVTAVGHEEVVSPKVNAPK